VTASTPAEVAAVLRAAATRLETKGWCQGDSGEEEGPNCLAGALNLVAGRADRQQSARRAFNAFVRSGDVHVVWPWNDAPGRTADEVIATLRACADAVERGELAVTG
jgi:hypothetical protein